jgi:hypothetical protein
MIFPMIASAIGALVIFVVMQKYPTFAPTAMALLILYSIITFNVSAFSLTAEISRLNSDLSLLWPLLVIGPVLLDLMVYRTLGPRLIEQIKKVGKV